MTIGTFLAATTVMVAAAVTLSGNVQAPSAMHSVWDGVYSSAQAERGKTLYESNCASCHGSNLNDGQGVRPALTGRDFMSSWDGATLNDLFTKVVKTMPRDSVGILGEADSLDVIAYILQFNALPAGSADLAVNRDVLADIQIAGKGGPLPPATGSLVRVVGCLAQGPDTAWSLVKASAPAKTRNALESTGRDLMNAEKTPLGTGTVRLSDGGAVPESGKGHRMEAKGMLTRTPAEDRIDVLSIQALSTSCDRE